MLRLLMTEELISHFQQLRASASPRDLDPAPQNGSVGYTGVIRDSSSYDLGTAVKLTMFAFKLHVGGKVSKRDEYLCKHNCAGVHPNQSVI